MISVRPAQTSDIHAIVTGIRDEDRIESMLFTGKPLKRVLRESLATSTQAFVICHNYIPVVMFGVAPVPGQGVIGSVWLRATKDISKVSKFALQHARLYLKQFVFDYPAGLLALAHGENAVHLAWLKAAGFEVNDTPYIINDSPFYGAKYV